MKPDEDDKIDDDDKLDKKDKSDKIEKIKPLKSTKKTEKSTKPENKKSVYLDMKKYFSAKSCSVPHPLVSTPAQDSPAITAPENQTRKTHSTPLATHAKIFLHTSAAAQNCAHSRNTIPTQNEITGRTDERRDD